MGIRHIPRIALLAGLLAIAGCGATSQQAGTPSAVTPSHSAETTASPTTTTEPAESSESPGSSEPAEPTDSQPAEPTSAAPEGDPPGTRCPNVVITAAEIPADVYVRAGNVDCASATQSMQDYFTKLKNGEGPGAGGNGPVTVGEWTCASGTATDPWSRCSTDDGREIEAVFWE
ncbi:hypothetical protein ABZ639_30910 [Saccharomonospora sp. NPDC006951]